MFDAARERPCVLLLDECDFIARSRVASKDIGEVARIVNTLLQLMEEYDAPGILVATTNIESSLDEALFRRFDDVFQVPLPGSEEIEKLLRLTLSSVELDGDISWNELVKMLVGFSAAHVVKCAQAAAKMAVLSVQASPCNSLQAVSETPDQCPTRTEDTLSAAAHPRPIPLPLV